MPSTFQKLDKYLRQNPWAKFTRKTLKHGTLLHPHKITQKPIKDPVEKSQIIFPMHTHLLIVVEQILIKICRWTLRLGIVGHGGERPLDGLLATDDNKSENLSKSERSRII